MGYGANYGVCMHGKASLDALAFLSLLTIAARGDTTLADGGGGGGGGVGDGGNGSSTAGSSAGGATSVTIEEACQGLADRDLACYEDPDFDVPSCVAKEACFRKIYRDEAEQPMLDCFAAWSSDPDCEGDWCSDKIQGDLTAAAEHTAHAAKCASYEADCGQGAGDICKNPVVQLAPDLVAAFGICLDGQCADLDACLEAAVDDYLASCGGDVSGLW